MDSPTPMAIEMPQRRGPLSDEEKQRCREDSRVRVLLKRPPGSWIGENVRQDRG